MSNGRSAPNFVRSRYQLKLAWPRRSLPLEFANCPPSIRSNATYCRRLNTDSLSRDIPSLS